AKDVLDANSLCNLILQGQVVFGDRTTMSGALQERAFGAAVFLDQQQHHSQANTINVDHIQGAQYRSAAAEEPEKISDGLALRTQKNFKKGRGEQKLVHAVEEATGAADQRGRRPLLAPLPVKYDRTEEQSCGQGESPRP